MRWHHHVYFKAHQFTELLVCITHTKQQELSQNKTNLYVISQCAQVSSHDAASSSEKQPVTGVDKFPTTIQSLPCLKNTACKIIDGNSDGYTRFPLVLSVQLLSEILQH